MTTTDDPFAGTDDPFAKLDDSAFQRPPRSKTTAQQEQLIYSHLLTAKADYEDAEDGNEVSDRISALNKALAKRGALVHRDTYEQVCQQYLRDTMGRGFV